MLTKQVMACAFASLSLLSAGCNRDKLDSDQQEASSPAIIATAEPADGSKGLTAQAPPFQASAANKDVTTRHVSGRAFTVEDFGSNVSGSATDVIEQLKDQALAGDATASYAIFLKLNECVRLNERRAKGQPVRADEALISSCNKLSAEDEVSSPKWLGLAAEQGNIGAQLLYSMDSASALGGPAALLRDPEAVIEYKARAKTYLESLASQGSIDALLQLGNAYQAGVLVPEDLVTSRAYFEAVRLADPSLVSKMQLKGLEGSMSPDQLSLALRKGEEIHGSCCR